MRGRLAIALLAVVQVLVLTAGIGLAVGPRSAAPVGDDTYVLLVLGSDAGPPRPGAAVEGRADAIQVVVVRTDLGKVSILSIPRDSFVPVAGMGTRKINAGLTRGPETMVATVESLTGLEVDDWMVTGFRAFIDGIDAIGGVELEVDQRLNDPRGAKSDLQPGLQRLDGTQALAYTRDRKSRGDGDFGRNRAQAHVLAAVHAELAASSPSLPQLVELLGVVRSRTETSIPPDRLVRLGVLAMRIDPADVIRQQVPARVGTAGAASVVRLTGGAEEMFADLRDDGMFAVHTDG
jgi:polyisoprenyl-teichoic acid--peptidoglycan teichoic acid transferase